MGANERLARPELQDDEHRRPDMKGKSRLREAVVIRRPAKNLSNNSPEREDEKCDVYTQDQAHSLPGKSETFVSAVAEVPSRARRATSPGPLGVSDTHVPPYGGKEPDSDPRPSDSPSRTGIETTPPLTLNGTSDKSGGRFDGVPLLPVQELPLPTVYSKPPREPKDAQQQGLETKQCGQRSSTTRREGLLPAIPEDALSSFRIQLPGSGKCQQLNPELLQHLRKAPQESARQQFQHPYAPGSADGMPSFRVSTHYEDSGEPLDMETALKEAMDKPLINALPLGPEDEEAERQKQRSGAEAARLVMRAEEDEDVDAFIEQLDAAFDACPTLGQLQRREAYPDFAGS